MLKSLGDRIKENYENRSRYKLARRTPVIMRLDGKAFHTLTKKCDKPFDSYFIEIMNKTSLFLLKEIQGAKCSYTQSDEISILITDFDRFETEAWFDYNIQKMTSVAAGLASSYFTRNNIILFSLAIFDCRVFNIPKEEVVNYFLWRQKDWYRNSLQMYARSIFSHKELLNKNHAEIHEMIHNKERNWSTDLQDYEKNGTFYFKTEEGFEENNEVISNNDFGLEYIVFPYLYNVEE